MEDCTKLYRFWLEITQYILFATDEDLEEDDSSEEIDEEDNSSEEIDGQEHSEDKLQDIHSKEREEFNSKEEL